MSDDIEFTPTDDERQAIATAERLAHALGKSKHLNDFFKLRAVLKIGRAHAQRVSGNPNSVQNRGYAEAFARWLQDNLPKVSLILKPHDIEALHQFSDPVIMEEWEAIVARMTPYERSRINTPASAWNRLKRERAAARGVPVMSKAANKAASREELQRLNDEISAMSDYTHATAPDVDDVFRDYLMTAPLAKIGGAITSLPRSVEMRTRLSAIGEQIRATLAGLKTESERLGTGKVEVAATPIEMDALIENARNEGAGE